MLIPAYQFTFLNIAVMANSTTYPSFVIKITEFDEKKKRNFFYNLG